jgi:hypothetical protein
MTIGEYIYEYEIDKLRKELDNLVKSKAPQLLISRVQTVIDRADKEHSVYVGGRQQLLGWEVDTHELKRGKNGLYISFNGGDVNYFPQAKNGPFIALAKPKGRVY